MLTPLTYSYAFLWELEFQILKYFLLNLIAKIVDNNIRRLFSSDNDDNE